MKKIRETTICMITKKDLKTHQGWMIYLDRDNTIQNSIIHNCLKIHKVLYLN